MSTQGSNPNEPKNTNQNANVSVNKTAGPKTTTNTAANNAKETMNKVMTNVKSVVNKENLDNINEKYVKPFLAFCKRIAIQIWELIVKYTPVVIAFLKKVWEKAYAMGVSLYQTIQQKIAERKKPPSSGPTAGGSGTSGGSTGPSSTPPPPQG